MSMATENSTKESAIDYAKARAKFGHGEIRVLNPDGSIEQRDSSLTSAANE